VPVDPELDVGSVLVVLVVVDVDVLVELDVDVLVDVAGSVVEVVAETGNWGVAEVVVVVVATPLAGSGNVHNAEAQSVGVAAWAMSIPGHAVSVNTWS